MNIAQANAVPIVLLLDRLNIKPSKTNGSDCYYLAPWRNEKTASLHVQTKNNVWYDHGIGEGGDCVAFVCKHLKESKENYTVPDALRWIEIVSGKGRLIKPIQILDIAYKDPNKALGITKVDVIRDKGLIDYLESRGIPLTLAQRYLKEIRVYNKNSKKHFVALGFENEDGAYELRNRYFKGCIGTKDITFIRGTNSKPEGVHIIEGFMDFLSIVWNAKDWALKDDSLVLNSLVNLQRATPYIKNYGYSFAYSWTDNDNGGRASQKSLDEFFKSEPGLRHEPMNRRYEPYKDVNEWHMHKLNLAPQVE